MRIVVYPGSFNPITNGHTDLVKRALVEVGREDLIGEGSDCLIPSRRPAQPNRAPKRERGGRDAGLQGARGGYRWAARKGPEK